MGKLAILDKVPGVRFGDVVLQVTELLGYELVLTVLLLDSVFGEKFGFFGGFGVGCMTRLARSEIIRSGVFWD